MSPDPAIVTVRATAHRSARPDAFSLTVRSVIQAGDATAASQSLATGWSYVEDALTTLADRRLEVERSGLSLTRNSWHDAQRAEMVVQWHAARQATVRSRSLEDAGPVIAAFAPSGDHPEGLEIIGPNWLLDHANPVHGQVVADAVHAARARAEQYAAAAGATLGALIELADVGDAVPRGLARTMSAAPSGGVETVNFDPEQIEVSATVEGRWQLIG